VLTFRTLAAGAPGEAVAYAAHLLEKTLDDEGLALAAYYGRYEQATRDALDLGIGSVPLMRADTDPALAAALGMNPNELVQEKALANLMGGRRADGEELPVDQATVRSYSGGGKDGGPRSKISGIDFCASAPKSVSLAWMAAKDDAERAAILQAHRQANATALRYIEEQACIVGMGKGGKACTERARMTWISVDHYTARSTVDILRCDPVTGVMGTEIHTVRGGARIPGDPQLHTHNFAPNVLITESGRLVAMDRNRLKGRIKEFGAVYQAALAANLRQAGIHVALDMKTGMACLPCIPERACEEFSKRSRDGEAAARAEAARRGLDWDTMDPDHKVDFLKGGALASRKFKADDLAQVAAWREMMERIGWKHTSAKAFGPVAPRVSEPVRHAQGYEAGIEGLAPEVERRAVMSGWDLRAAAARGLIEAGMESTDEVSILTRMMAAIGIKQDDQITKLEWRDNGDDGPKVTTRLHADQEAELIRLTQAGAADRSGALTVEEMRAAVERLGVRYQGQTGREQIDAVKKVGQAGRVAVFVGAAGVGKTSRVLPPLVEAWKAQGREVWGVSLAWRQANALEEAGIPKLRTVAMQPFLKRLAAPGERNGITLTAKSVVVIDELSQVGTRQLLDLLRERERIGFTLVMTGDPRQAQSVDAGPVITLLREALGEDAVPQIITVVRQATEREREIASLFRGRDGENDEVRLAAVTKALGMKREDGTAELTEGGYRDALARIAALYMERVAANRDTGGMVTVSVPTNAEALDVSREIRGLRRAAGEIGADEGHLKAKDGAGNHYTLAIAKGDRVRLFQRTRATFTVKGTPHEAAIGNNGSVLTVREVRRDGLVLETAAGKAGFVPWKGFRERGAGEGGRLRLAYGDSLTIDSAQGITSDEHIMALPSGTRGLQGLKGYVAASRHRHRNWLVVSKGMELREVADRRPLNAEPFADRETEDKALWANVARNLAQQPIKESALAMLGELQRGSERSAASLRTAAGLRQARERVGMAAHRLRAAFTQAGMRKAVVEISQQLEETMRARVPLIQRLAAISAAAKAAEAQRAAKARPTAPMVVPTPANEPAPHHAPGMAEGGAPPREAPRPTPTTPRPVAQPRRVEVSEGEAAVQLRETLRNHGLTIKGDPVFDGRIHYVAVEGNRGREKSGAYKAQPHPKLGYVASIWNWKAHSNYNGYVGRWRADGETVLLSPEQAAKAAAEEAKRAAERERSRVVKEARAAVRAVAVVGKAKPAPSDHPYLIAKGLELMPDGLLVNRRGDLVLPLQNADGRVRSYQTIAADGGKLYLKDAQKIGVFAPLGPLVDGKPVIVAEGLATAGTVREATGQTVVVALDTSNLMAVALALREKLPNSPILFAADNDHHLPRRNIPLINAGKEKAERAAAEVGGRVLLAPEIRERAAAGKGTDWNDMHALRGLGAVRDALREAWRAAETPTVQAKVEQPRAGARQGQGM
jgi:phage/plasmid primase-like uncharacterized protein